ncbi:hypothetical protein WKI65_38705 [Streptomyces sp. MS1.AVA.3]|uniref:hypothetical protein n=1 Tax=Streptomyces decoyicus TaxID=249567 RepID=UPI0030C3CCDE
MLDATALDQATAVIEKAWGRPIEALESLTIHNPCDDPLLRAALYIRSALVITDNAVAVHQDRLHALTRPGHVPAFYDQERATSSAADLRVAQAESHTFRQALGHVIEAHEAAATADRAPAVQLAQAAVDPPRPDGRRTAERSGEVVIAVGTCDAGVHRAGQLLHRQLDATPLRDPVLHHRVLVPPPVALRSDGPLAVGDHRDVAHRPRPPGGKDLALQPGSVPVPARLRHSGSPFGSVRPLPQPG